MQVCLTVKLLEHTGNELMVKVRENNSQKEISEIVRDHEIASNGLVEGLSWKGGIIYSEMRVKRGTVELGIERNARDCAQHTYTLLS